MNESKGARSHALAAAIESLAPRSMPSADPLACFRDLLDKVNLIAVTIDRDARITYCNKFFLAITGWAFAEIEGRIWHEVFVPPGIEDLRPLFADMFRDLPEAWHHENDLLTRAGDRRSIRWNNILLRDSMGNAVGAGSIGEDVTDRKKLERALADYHDRERSDLEKAMYDGLGQELAGIALLARSLATSAARDQLAIAQDLHRLSVIASKSIESCSKIARGFAPFSELHGGLVHAIRLLTVVPREWSGPRLEFSLLQTAPMTLTAEACAHVYHWVLEGLTHAIKNSGARLIQIALMVDPAEVCVKISDDGLGVPVGASKMMQHRAALLQATLRYEALDGGGTRLTLTCGQP